MNKSTPRNFAVSDCSLAFCASTGRTATMFLAKTLNSLPDVVALHEGHLMDEDREPRLPLINLHNRKAWGDADYAFKAAGKLRSVQALNEVADGASLLVDVAFNNAPFLEPLSKLHPNSKFIAIFRRCEGFVRSSTIVTGEDEQPAGWPDRSKPLTDREQFISVGRLKPSKGNEFAELWDQWTGIQRNIWLWATVNTHLEAFVTGGGQRSKILFEDLTDQPSLFWEKMLGALDVLSEANHAKCVEKSARKTNQRDSYQIGPLTTWSPEEQALYEKIARPLEEKIYGG